MRSLNPTLLVFVVVGMVGAGPPGSAAAQPVAKASFLAEGSFSLPSSGEGALERPIAIAWSPSGEILVADEGGAIVVFDPSGVYVRSFGTDLLRKVGAMDVDAERRVFVLDTEAKSVLVFDAGGALLHRIGSAGKVAGELDRPADVAVGPGGLVYVLDTGLRGVQVFSLDGTFVHDMVLSPEVKDPRALAVGPSGHVYVADQDAPGTLTRLPPITEAFGTLQAPTPAATIAVRGGNARDPIAVVATPTGAVAVGDRDSGGLWYVDGAGGETVGSDDRLYGGSGSGRGSFRKLQDAHLATDSEMVLLDRDGRKVERIRLVLEDDRPAEDVLDYPVLLQGVEPALDPGVLASTVRPEGGARYAIADAEGRNLRVVEADLVEREGVFGDRIRLPVVRGPLHDLSGAVERAGNVAMNDTLIVVTEPRRNRFHVIDLRTDQSIGSFGDNYSDDRRLRSPRGVALFSDGRIAVADNGNDRIAVFSADVATLLGTYPLPKAEGVVISRDGRMFAWDEEGRQAGEFPLGGGAFRPLSESLSLGWVGAMSTDAAGNLYVLRFESSRVAILDSGAERILARVGAEEAVEDGDRLAVDPDGNIYATDMRRGATAVVRWGVDVPPVESVTAQWRPGSAELSWAAVPGSFVTGYVVEGADDEEGPWSEVAITTSTTAQVEGAALTLYRVSPRTLTGAIGRASPLAPVLHLAADAAFSSGDWEEAGRLARESLDRGQGRGVAMDPAVQSSLAWMGFESAHEAGDATDVLAWSATLGTQAPQGRTFEYASFLSDAHQELGDLEAATARAMQAIQAGRTDRSRTEALTGLRMRVFENGSELGQWQDVAAVGDEILRVDPTQAEGVFVERLARAHLEAGSAGQALALVQRSLAAGAPSGARRRLVILAFMASAAMEDYTTALEYADAAGDSLPASMFVDYELALARVLLATGDLPGALAELMHLLEEEESPQSLSDPELAATALLVYAGFIESGDAEGGERMLDSLTSALPVELMELRARIRDEQVGVAAVASTRHRLGEGLQYFQDAMFRDAVRFFQAADERDDLDVDQRIIVKEVLASVFHSLGRVEDADAAYRAIYEVDPDFDLDAHLAHVQEVFGVTILTEEMITRFRALGPIM